MKKFISRHKFLTGFLCGLLVIPFLLILFWFEAIGHSMIIWQSYQMDLPGTNNQLIFYWKTIHPFLAEYDRKVQIISGKHKSPKYWLQTNTGGRHHLNLYIIEMNHVKWLRISDEYSEFVTNLDTLQGYSVGAKSGKTFIGLPAKGAYWGFFGSDKSGSIEAKIGNAKGTYDPRFEKRGRFIGTLDARSGLIQFIPAAKMPEEHIRTQNEQAEEMDKTIGTQKLDCDKNRGKK